MPTRRPVVSKHVLLTSTASPPLADRGHVLIGGAILDEAGDMIGSIVLADFPSRSELDTWLRTDPYVTQGVWQEIEVRDFRPAVGAWFPDEEV